MNNQEYEQQRRKCWEEYVNLLNHNSAARYVFDKIFDRAYALGKQEKDAEGEEMLTVSAITVREMYAANERIKTDAPDKELGRTSDHINHVLRCLFGSKCLPDKAPKPAEPKEESRNLSQETANCDKQFDTILKNSFAKERRLKIAAMMAQGILSNTDRMKQYGEIAMRESETLTQLVARNAMRYADALIAEGEKGGENEG